MPQSNFDQYLDDLITLKFGQVHALEPAARTAIKRDIARQLDNFVMSKAISALSDGDVQRLEALMKNTRSLESAQEFAATHVPEFGDFLRVILLEFREVYMKN